MEAEVSEDCSAREESATHAGKEMPMRPIGWAVRLRHMIGLFYYLTVDLKHKRTCDLSTNLCLNDFPIAGTNKILFYSNFCYFSYLNA